MFLGDYEFLHTVTCPKRLRVKSPYLNPAVQSYWAFVQGVGETDRLLTHIHAFKSNPTFYTIPEPLLSGQALFYFPQNSREPQLLSR